MGLIFAQVSGRQSDAIVYSYGFTHLPYCSKFVTHDDRQLNALRLVVIHGDLQDVEVLSYQEFHDGLILTTRRCMIFPSPGRWCPVPSPAIGHRTDNQPETA